MSDGDKIPITLHPTPTFYRATLIAKLDRGDSWLVHIYTPPIFFSLAYFRGPNITYFEFDIQKSNISISPSTHVSQTILLFLSSFFFLH